MSVLGNPTQTKLYGHPIADEDIDIDLQRIGGQIKWTFICYWAEQQALTASMLGGAFVVGDVASIISPMSFPRYAGMFCRSCHVRMVPGNGGLSRDAKYLVATTYARVEATFSFEELDTGNEQVEYSAQVLTVPNNFFMWQSSGKQIISNESPGIIIPRVQMKTTKNYLANIPVGTIMSLLGKVNASTFLGNAAETVLYMGASSNRQFTTNGSRMWSLTQTMLARPFLGWNMFLNPDTGAPDRIVTTVGSNPAYALADFTPLGFNKSAQQFNPLVSNIGSDMSDNSGTAVGT